MAEQEPAPIALSPAANRLIQDHLTMARRERSTNSTDWAAVYFLDVKMLYNRLRALETVLEQIRVMTSARCLMDDRHHDCCLMANAVNKAASRVGAEAEGD